MTKTAIDAAYEQKIVQEFKRYVANFPEQRPRNFGLMMANLMVDYEYDIECLTCKGEE